MTHLSVVTIEFKESADKSISDEVCAFANASGGRVFIGVTDKGKVVGTDTSNAARSRLQDTINKIEPRLTVDIDIHDNIIIITVPEGTSKPYSSPNGFYLQKQTYWKSAVVLLLSVLPLENPPLSDSYFCGY